jgi:hypothetical protein
MTSAAARAESTSKLVAPRTSSRPARLAALQKPSVRSRALPGLSRSACGGRRHDARTRCAGAARSGAPRSGLAGSRKARSEVTRPGRTGSGRAIDPSKQGTNVHKTEKKKRFLRMCAVLPVGFLSCSYDADALFSVPRRWAVERPSAPPVKQDPHRLRRARAAQTGHGDRGPAGSRAPLHLRTLPASVGRALDLHAGRAAGRSGPHARRAASRGSLMPATPRFASEAPFPRPFPAEALGPAPHQRPAGSS